jgi:DNA invertase Pin-like site-specific DNA recombinase
MTTTAVTEAPLTTAAGPALRAAIYVRISLDRAGNAKGVGRQDVDATEHCQRMGWQIVEVFVDNDRGASTHSRKARPAYLEMMRRARNGEFDAIVCYSQSRLTRRPREFEDVIDVAMTGVRIVTLKSGDYDFNTADGRAVARTIAAWDAAEAERTAERVTRAIKEQTDNGQRVGKVPYGWTPDPLGGPDLLHPEQAPLLQEAARRILAGESIYSVWNDFNARGLRTNLGNEWDATNLRAMLCRPRNAARMVVSGKETGARGKWAPILTDDELDRLTDRWRSNHRANATGVQHLLSGLARCGVCLAGMRVLIAKGRAPAYYCNQQGCFGVRRKRDDVDRIAVEALLRRLELPDAPALLGGDPEAMEEARAEIEAIQARLKHASRQYMTGKWTQEMLDEATESSLPLLEAARVRLRNAEPAPEFARFAGSNARAAWEAEESITVRRTLLDGFMTVTVLKQGQGRDFDERSVRIEWRAGFAPKG